MKLLSLLIFLNTFLAGVAAYGAPKTISKVPFTITKPGQYVLAKTLSYSGEDYAIRVEADDVTIDLRENILSFEAVGPVEQQTAGIFIQDRKNVTIRNGTIRGFFRGIYFETADVSGNGGHLVENVRADRCTFLGIQVKGRGSIVRNNWVSTVSGSTAFSAVRYGFDVTGDAALITGNRVTDVHVEFGIITNIAYGLRIHEAENCIVTDNALSNTPASSNANAVGISLANCRGAIISQNRVSRFGTGFEFIQSPQASYRNNTASNTLTPYDNEGDTAFDTGGNSL